MTTDDELREAFERAKARLGIQDVEEPDEAASGPVFEDLDSVAEKSAQDGESAEENPESREEGCYTGDLETQERQETRRDSPGREQPAFNPYALSTADFVKWAVEHSEQEESDGTGGTPYRTPLWTFTRQMKGYFQDADHQPDDVFDLAGELLQEWGGWSKYFDVADDKEAYTEFVSNWDKVRYLPGYGPLETAMRRAIGAMLLPPRCEKRDLPGYQLFVSLAGWLQVVRGNDDILLPCDKVADLFTDHGLKCDKMTVSRWRGIAIKDGFLKVTREHTFRPNGKGDATEFRFDVSLFECLADAAQAGTAEAFYQADGRPKEGGRGA